MSENTSTLILMFLLIVFVYILIIFGENIEVEYLYGVNMSTGEPGFFIAF